MNEYPQVTSVFVTNRMDGWDGSRYEIRASGTVLGPDHVDAIVPYYVEVLLCPFVGTPEDAAWATMKYQYEAMPMIKQVILNAWLDLLPGHLTQQREQAMKKLEENL